MPDGSGTESTFRNKLLKKISTLFKFRSKNIPNNSIQGNFSKDIDPLYKYQHLEASEIMIPRVDIIAINYSCSLDEIASTFLENRHTRMPVYRETLDNIIGYINIKDILPYLLNKMQKNSFNIETVIRKLLIISPSMKILDLLEKMRQVRTHIALVVDELGGADGLITIEDLVEELIGKIDDEFDNESEEELKEIARNKFEVSGRLDIDEFKAKLGINFDTDDKYETVGGLVISYLGRMPVNGEKFIHEPSGLNFEIVDCNERRINRVYVFLD